MPGKIALVTAAASGTGRAGALILAREGATVAVVDGETLAWGTVAARPSRSFDNRSGPRTLSDRYRVAALDFESSRHRSIVDAFVNPLRRGATTRPREPIMLKATEEEIEEIREYFEWQAPDLEVTFMQKVYSEAVLNTRHDVWDIHTNKDRWWVITGGTNLYSQEQFPNMDLALTFHIGLILRIPRTEAQQENDLRILPFGPVFEKIEEARTAVTQAHNLADYQAVGVRCREALLELIGVAQNAAIWTDTPPQRANFRAWTEIVCNDLLPGDTNKERRGALKGALESAWTFSNWLTHSKSATWIDADMAHSLTQHANGMATSLILRELRGVPEECPTCGSPLLEPEQAENTAAPGVLWERPRCADCGWTGRPVPILDLENGQAIITREGEGSDEHGIMTVPLRTIRKPGNPPIEPLKKTETGPPEPVVYFAYGSNMSTARLRERMPSCNPLGIAALPGHALRFHKRSTDKSGKCNAFASGEDNSVVGVLFSFDPAERAKLDKAEGVGSGYEHAMVTVINDKGRRRKVLTYLATPDYIDNSLKPYDWYKDFVLAGGREHGLPSEYIAEYIESVEAIQDPNKARDKKQRATLGSPGDETTVLVRVAGPDCGPDVASGTKRTLPQYR